MSSGLTTSRITGSKCKTINRCSRVCEGGRLIICSGTEPRWDVRNIYNE